MKELGNTITVCHLQHDAVTKAVPDGTTLWSFVSAMTVCHLQLNAVAKAVPNGSA